MSRDFYFAKEKYIVLFIISVVVIVFDQWTKQIILSSFRWGESKSIISSFFDLTYVRNTGAAFGLFHRAPEYFRQPFFIVVPILALFLVSFIFVRLGPRDKITVAGLSLIVGGAVGNLIDRLRFGYVVDFLDFHWKEIYHYPAFNVADSCIVVGVFLVIIQSFRQSKMTVKDSGVESDASTEPQPPEIPDSFN